MYFDPSASFNLGTTINYNPESPHIVSDETIGQSVRLVGLRATFTMYIYTPVRIVTE